MKYPSHLMFSFCSWTGIFLMCGHSLYWSGVLMCRHSALVGAKVYPRLRVVVSKFSRVLWAASCPDMAFLYEVIRRMSSTYVRMQFRCCGEVDGGHSRDVSNANDDEHLSIFVFDVYGAAVFSCLCLSVACKAFKVNPITVFWGGILRLLSILALSFRKDSTSSVTTFMDPPTLWYIISVVAIFILLEGGWPLLEVQWLGFVLWSLWGSVGHR